MQSLPCQVCYCFKTWGCAHLCSNGCSHAAGRQTGTVEWRAARGELGNRAASGSPALAAIARDSTVAACADGMPAAAESLGRRFMGLSTEQQDARALLAQRVKERFGELMAGGSLLPNEAAAAAALKWAAAQQ